MNAPRTKWIFLLALLTLFAGVCTCLADTPSPEAVAKWQHLSDAEKAALRKRYKVWQSLSEAQKQALRQKVKAFKALPPEERQRIRKNFQRFKSLPPEQQDAIGLAYFYGMSHSDIAAYRSLPLGTVKTRIRQGMQKLRTMWLADQPSNPNSDAGT